MPIDAAPSADPAVPGPDGLAPQWGLVHFEVSCPRCGFDVRGRTIPRCPRCALAFDWRELVPLEELTCSACGYHLYGLRETRCPECGAAFDWEQVVHRYRSSRLPIHEYRTGLAMLRAIPRTWLRTLRPGRFWSLLTLNHPPQAGRILIFAAVMMVVLYLLLPLVTIGYDCFSLQYYYGRRGMSSFDAALLAAFNTIASIPSYHRDREMTTAALLGISWSLASLLSLFVFVISMHRSRVTYQHVLRVWAYAVSSRLTLFPIAFFVLQILYRLRYPSDPTLVDVLVCLALLASVVWAIRQGYVRYLHMDHALAVAIFSQIVACMMYVAVASFVMPGSTGHMVD